jgi:formylglycine-generating enzyme required for sulfatase activity
MKNPDSHFEEKELDQLLRQFVLEGEDDEFTQNTLTMNADFIFTASVQASPDIVLEKELITKLEHAFIKPRGFAKFWLSGIIFAGLFIAAISFYKYKSETSSTDAQQTDPGKKYSAATISSIDTSGNNEQQVRVVSVAQISSPEISSDSISKSDSFPVEKTNQSEKLVPSNDVIPIERNWYSGNYDVIVPGPVYTAKASPENFKAAQGDFKVDTSQSSGGMFTCKQGSFSTAYYSGTPFKSGMNDMQYFNFGEYVQSGKSRFKLPWAILEYADTNELKKETVTYSVNNEKRSHDWLFMYKIPERGIQIATQPFYFRKYEVTNKEYREFVNWVRASNGYGNKQILSSHIDTVLVNDSLEWGGEVLTIKGKKYRIRRNSTHTADYNEVYNYVFFNQNSDAVKQLGQNSLYVYPDTVSWVNDFLYGYQEPMTNMYFWHPAYDNYPVVGVSWFQAMAFLDWKTHFHQQQLDANGIPYEIEYTLPSDIEWDLASISLVNNKNTEFRPMEECTNNWLSDLALSFPGHDDLYQRTNYLKNLLTPDQNFQGDYIEDGYFHTGPADLESGKNNQKSPDAKHLDLLGISWMDGNVSEWMQESYSQNWKPFFLKHLLILDSDKNETSAIARQIEMLYDNGNAQNGKLVRGANWYDERFGGKPGTGRNETGISPKRFVNPSEKHCTVGFRYVIHVKTKGN